MMLIDIILGEERIDSLKDIGYYSYKKIILPEEKNPLKSLKMKLALDIENSNNN